MPARKKTERSTTTPQFNRQQLLILAGVLLVLVIIALVNSRQPAAVPLPPPTATPAPQQAIAPATSATELPGWLVIHYTNPNPPDNLKDGVDQYVVPALNGATRSIDMTSFDLNLPSVVNALVSASQRGVAVRVVVDGENGEQTLAAGQSPDGKVFKALDVFSKARIPVVNGGRSNGLMHDKLIIVDGKLLFMGSWNMSYNDTFRNNNNLLQITAPALIANYQAKFDELFKDKQFGTHAKVGALTASATIDGVQVENYFSPVDEVMQKLVQYVGGAKKSIHFMAFTYTDAGLSAAMIARAKAGVDVQGVIENRGASEGAMVPLACAKLPVKVDGNKYTMHHKVIIIDGQYVITGSFNFTKSADTANDDNVLVIHSPAVAALYEQEYARVYGAGKAPDPASVDCSKVK